MKRKFTIELLDVPYFARPSLGALDVALTARRIQTLRRGGGGRSYDGAFSLIPDMTTGLATLEQLLSGLASTKDDDPWKEHLKEVAELLFALFGCCPGRWYAADRKPHQLYDRLWFKHPIRGVWFHEGRATATLVNPRRGLSFDPLTRSFLSRGVFEFYLRDEPNIHDYLIVDLGVPPRADVRELRLYTPEMIDPMPLEQFEHVLRRFLQAVEHAGFAAQPSAEQSIADLFRKK